MSARVGTFTEPCPARVEGARHSFEPTGVAIERGIVKLTRLLKLRCLMCGSVVRVESRWPE